MKNSLDQLKAIEKKQLELAKKMLKAYNESLYNMDILVSAALNRSLSLSKGFRVLINEKNLICAGALLRLQIDTAIRIFAGTLVENSNKFVRDVSRGKHIRNLKDRDGNKMTDKYLVEKLSDEYPWLPTVYEKTSSYIHFSDTHIFSSMHTLKNEEKTISIKISSIDKEETPQELYIEAIQAFIASTKMLIRFIEGWIFTKSNPELAKSLREEYLKKG